MTDKHTANQIEAMGENLALRAESGSLAVVNKELQDIRSQNPKEYGSIVKAMERRNFDHVETEREDLAKRNAHKHLWQSNAEPHVPKLTIVDKSKDRSHPDYQIQSAGPADKAVESAANSGTANGFPADRGAKDRNATAAHPGARRDEMPGILAYSLPEAFRQMDMVLHGDPADLQK